MGFSVWFGDVCFDLFGEIFRRLICIAYERGRCSMFTDFGLGLGIGEGKKNAHEVKQALSRPSCIARAVCSTHLCVVITEAGPGQS